MIKPRSHVLTEQEVENNKQRIIALYQTTQREGIDGLIEWLLTTDFFTAPASCRLGNHNCEVGGLADHCLNVYNIFEEMLKGYEGRGGIRPDESIIASLSHDLCKIGYYVPNPGWKGTGSTGELDRPYIRREDVLGPGGVNALSNHSRKSLEMASRFIRLTQNESLLIEWHMGRFDDDTGWVENSDGVLKILPAVDIFQEADYKVFTDIDYRPPGAREQFLKYIHKRKA